MSGDVNGAELALRIAYFDVVGKWRRSQEKCKYLEESRNLLVKELIRIKQVNEDLLKENSALTASLETSASLPNRTEVATSGNLRQAKSHSPLIPGTSADRNRQDEQDVEQITQRLLTELQKEIARTRVKSSQPLPLVAAASSDKNLLIDDDAGIAANNSVGSELLVANQPITSTSCHRSDHVQWNKNQGRQLLVNGGSGVCEAGGAERSDLQDEKRQAAVVSQTKVAADSNPGTGTGAGDVRNEESLSHVYAKIIASLTADLNKATGRIVSQNEKLTKLKSRQLRSYFRRQLKGETDQMSGNIPNAGSRCHTEHV